MVEDFCTILSIDYKFLSMNHEFDLYMSMQGIKISIFLYKYHLYVEHLENIFWRKELLSPNF